MKSEITPFLFDSQTIRVLTINNAPWFVAKDVAQALEYSRFDSNLIRHVPDEWKGTNPIRTLSGIQEMLTLSEPGLYFFVNRSDKPRALPFQKWIAGEVLPSIRQTGSYALPSSGALASQPRLYFAASRIARNLEVARSIGGRAALHDQLRTIHQQLGLPPIMPVEMFGKPADQGDQMPLEV
jgi:hypothetical protein